MGRVALCRDARSSVRCIKGYSIVVLTGTDAQTVRPYMSLPVSNSDFREEIPNMSKETPNMSSRFE